MIAQDHHRGVTRVAVENREFERVEELRIALRVLTQLAQFTLGHRRIPAALGRAPRNQAHAPPKRGEACAKIRPTGWLPEGPPEEPPPLEKPPLPERNPPRGPRWICSFSLRSPGTFCSQLWPRGPRASCSPSPCRLRFSYRKRHLSSICPDRVPA